MPTLLELTDLFDVLPEQPPPLPRQRRPAAALHSSSTSQAVVPPTSSQAPSLIYRLFLWAFSSTLPISPAVLVPKANPFMALKAGSKTIVIAVVDAGSISFFRFSQGTFSDWPMAWCWNKRVSRHTSGCWVLVPWCFVFLWHVQYEDILGCLIRCLSQVWLVARSTIWGTNNDNRAIYTKLISIDRLSTQDQDSNTRVHAGYPQSNHEIKRWTQNVYLFVFAFFPAVVSAFSSP